jgi:hypothetical protein
MQGKSFGLRTSANFFAQTLHDLTQFVHLRRFPFDSPTGRQGYFSLQPIRLPANPIGQQAVTLYVRCSYTPEDQPASPDYPDFWAIRFKIVSPAADYISVTAECAHEPVMGYFSQLLKDIGWPFPGSARAVEMTGTGWPDVIQVTRAELEQATAPLPFEPQHVYRHLCVLCDHDARFLLGKPETGGHLEMLAVLDAEAVRLAYTATQATIGTMRLLPADSGTAIQFTPHDAPFHSQIPQRGRLCFRNWIQRVKTHFDELVSQEAQAESSAPTGDDESQERGPKVGTLDRVREAHRLMKNGCPLTKACRRAHTDTRTYSLRCVEATGEDPVEPYAYP